MLKDTYILEVGLLVLEDMSHRDIRAMFPIGNSTLSNFSELLKSQNFTREKWEKLTDEQRRYLLYPKAGKSGRKPVQISDKVFEEIYKKLSDRRIHYTIYNGWAAYRKGNPQALQYSQFVERYRQWENNVHPGNNVTSPIFRTPGKFLYLDWVGDLVPLVGTYGEKLQKAHIFVTTMGYSSLVYAEAFPDEKTESVVTAINHSFQYCQALPQALRPDNMKTAVISNTKEGIVLSTAMEDLQNYYDIPVLPARPHSPKDKATVERAVQIIEKEFISEISDQTFPSFTQLNERLTTFIDALNNRVKSDEKMSRFELFKHVDLPEMRPLPEQMFYLPEYLKVKVPRNCHVRFKDYFYSVPYQYAGQEVIIKASTEDILICDSHNRNICSHKIATEGSKRYITVKEHLAANYQKAYEIETRGTQTYLDWAAGIGPSMEQFIQEIFTRAQFEEQAYRSCDCILRLCDKHPAHIGEEVAGELLKMHSVSQTAFTKAFRHKIKDEKAESEKTRLSESETGLPEHDNIRGETYYS